MQRRLASWFFVGLWALCFGLPGAALSAPEHNDVRVLIDISGSMKQNDPENLRRPALRMLVGLMQPGTRAGVWTFAKWSNPLVPLAEVDEAWKKRALAAAEQIKSPGAYTHVERVIEAAIKGWSGEPKTHNRHLVLLTDGMVDVSKTPGESAQSRARIIEQWLPKLKALGVHVHTIALSERADHDLMKQLSSNTDGWYQQVNQADKLQRTFLKIFEQVGKPDSVPLTDNKFTVDSSVREATVLLFRKPDSEAPVLISPSGEEFTDTDLPGGVAWYRDQGYDLVTISSPGKGEWALRADVDPDNRVMIVTDLKLQTSEIPAHVAVGESVLMSANLTARGKLVQRKAFLRLLDVRADAMTEAGSDPQGLNDAGEEGDAKAGDGRYSMRYKENRAFDEVELLFSVESPTFMREKRYRLSVHEPAKLTVSQMAEGMFAKLELDKAILRDGAEVQVWQRDKSGAKADLQKTPEGYKLNDPKAPVYANVQGQTQLGNMLSQEYGPVYAEGVSPPAVEPAATAEPKAPTVGESETKAPEVAPEPEAKPDPVVEAEPEEEAGWLMPTLIFGGVNLMLIIVGVGAWMLMRKRKSETSESLLDDLEEAPEPQAEALESAEETADTEGPNISTEQNDDEAEDKGEAA